MDPRYYRERAVSIHPKVSSGVSPGFHYLRTFLADFGTICDLRKFSVKEGKSVNGPPNTAVVIFDSPIAVEKVLHSSTDDRDEQSFWRKYSITAHRLGKDGPLDQIYLTRILPRLTSKLNERASESVGAPTSGPKRLARSDLEDSGPQAKRPRTEGFRRTSDGTNEHYSHTSIAHPHRASGVTPESPEWMCARIAQLEAELDNAKAVRDMVVSEQDIIRAAHKAEQSARREAMSQKSAAEAALSRNEVEQERLRSDLGIALSHKSALSNDVDSLREQLATTDEKLKLAQSLLGEFTNSSERVKTLESELEEARDQVHKLELQKSQLEQHGTIPASPEPNSQRLKIKELKSLVKQLKSDLASTEEQLTSTQKSLDSTERKYSSARRRYESAKAKVGTYKARLENEQTLVKKLKDTLTPEAYQSLGATHETLGAFLSAMGLPPASEDGSNQPKEESE